jgi:hypothetical protein
LARLLEPKLIAKYSRLFQRSALLVAILLLCVRAYATYLECTYLEGLIVCLNTYFYFDDGFAATNFISRNNSPSFSAIAHLD